MIFTYITLRAGNIQYSFDRNFIDIILDRLVNFPKKRINSTSYEISFKKIG